MSLVLIVDDVPAMREQYAYDLERLGGFQTLAAGGGAEAIQLLESEPVDCMILDLEMPGVDGFEVLRTLKKRGSRVPVIVYTGTGNFERCVRAVRLGAYTFIDKEEPLEKVVHEVDNALAWQRLQQEVATLRRRSGDDALLIGESPAMNALQAQLTRVAPIPSPILVLGESGTGKELVARQLHLASGRRRDVFVAVNCAALPENLVESELFGHERGAFTGADRTRKGAFENASGGTLFLDEIGELPVAAQAKLLRVLEENTVTRLGCTKPLRVDTRVVAATNRDLDAEVAAGGFRQDLLFRLNVHTLSVPPLRDRISDVPLLVDFFLTATCERFGVASKRIAPDALAVLSDHDWRRNNVRELRNVVERMIIACDGDTIEKQHLPADLQAGTAPGGDLPPEIRQLFTAAGSLKDLKSAVERQLILAALERNGWHITNSADELGLADHASLLKIMRRHGIKRPRQV